MKKRLKAHDSTPVVASFPGTQVALKCICGHLNFQNVWVIPRTSVIREMEKDGKVSGGEGK